MPVSIFANTTCEPHNNVSRSHFTPLLDPRTLTSRQRHQRCVITLQVLRTATSIVKYTYTTHTSIFSQTKFEKNPYPGISKSLTDCAESYDTYTDIHSTHNHRLHIDEPVVREFHPNYAHVLTRLIKFASDINHSNDGRRDLVNGLAEHCISDCTLSFIEVT